MKKTLLTIACLAAFAAFGTTASADIVFTADFESGTAANIGTITYTSTSHSQIALTGAPHPTHGNNSLLADPTSGGGVATDFRLTPTSAASLTGGQTAVMSLDFGIRRTNGATKSHYVTGYDTSDDIIFQFVLADANEFTNNTNNDRQLPGYATSVSPLAFVAADIATGSNPGTFYFAGDGNTADGYSGNGGQFDITVSASGWTLAADSTFNGAFTTNTLPTYSGTSHTELAYVEITGETTAAGGYFDNLSIVSVPEPSSAMLLVVGLGACVARRRRSR